MFSRLFRALSIAAIIIAAGSPALGETKSITSLSSDSRTVNELLEYLERVPNLPDTVTDEMIDDQIAGYVARLNGKKIQPSALHALIQKLPAASGQNREYISEVLRTQAAKFGLPESASRQVLNLRNLDLISILAVAHRKTPLSPGAKADLFAWIQAETNRGDAGNKIFNLLKLVTPEELARHPSLVAQIRSRFAQKSSTVLERGPHLMAILAPNSPIPDRDAIEGMSHQSAMWNKLVLLEDPEFYAPEAEVKAAGERTLKEIRASLRGASENRINGLLSKPVIDWSDPQVRKETLNALDLLSDGDLKPFRRAVMSFSTRADVPDEVRVSAIKVLDRIASDDIYARQAMYRAAGLLTESNAETRSIIASSKRAGFRAVTIDACPTSFAAIGIGQ